MSDPTCDHDMAHPRHPRTKGPTMTDNQEAESPVLTAMLEYGSAIRGDWSNFDGRTMRAIIEDWVQEVRTPDPSHTVEWHRLNLGLCMAGGGHWCGRWGYCDDECGCEPCAAERGGRDE